MSGMRKQCSGICPNCGNWTYFYPDEEEGKEYVILNWWFSNDVETETA